MVALFTVDNFTFEVIITKKEFKTLYGKGDNYELNTLIYKGMLTQALYISQYIDNLSN